MIKKFILTISLCLISSVAYAQTEIAPTIEKVGSLEAYTIELGDAKDVVVIGDMKDPTKFSPEITFTKWSNECQLKIIPDKPWFTSLTPTLSADRKSFEIENNKIGFYYAPQADNERFKFGIIWKEFPTSNSWSVDLAGWEDLDFLYQPPLSKDNPTGRKLRPDGVTYFDVRPENVVGSYAVYHKTKKNHEIGKTNYGTGKLFHWYRPRFINALGDWTWGTLVYENGRMTETCPWEFLEKARDNKAFPVRSNVDVGYSTGGGSSDWVGATQTSWGRFFGTAGSDGTLNYIYICTSGASSAKYALYSEKTGSKPNSRLCIDASDFSVAAAKGFHGNSVDYNYAITAGTQYWGGMEVTGIGEIYIYWDSGSDYVYIDNTDNLPATAPDPMDYEYADAKWSAYFSYTAGGGGETTPRRRIIIISKHENTIPTRFLLSDCYIRRKVSRTA